ncbi:hypothetical protein B0T10DRAFT_606434 [Thelonectria olida]|uniref:Uncharacterized protein n=1 Tax=Thelonectria olida TaxID=1576542 RepID=A0A9P9APR5_9HYPO|nr:hypothetical protein B0T10DRAFT_606434 [Thelonectria olida]
MALINAKNTVPENQRFYQAAYRAHTRVWRINPRSRLLLTPYVILLWGTFSAGLYGAGRKVLGYKTYFGKE